MYLYNSEMLTQTVLIFSDVQQLRKPTLIITRVLQKEMGQCQHRIFIVSQRRLIYLFLFLFIFALVTVLKLCTIIAGNKLILCS